MAATMERESLLVYLNFRESKFFRRITAVQQKKAKTCKMCEITRVGKYAITYFNSRHIFGGQESSVHSAQWYPYIHSCEYDVSDCGVCSIQNEIHNRVTKMFSK